MLRRRHDAMPCHEPSPPATLVATLLLPDIYLRFRFSLRRTPPPALYAMPPLLLMLLRCFAYDATLRCRLFFIATLRQRHAMSRLFIDAMII